MEKEIVSKEKSLKKAEEFIVFKKNKMILVYIVIFNLIFFF
jgi:hypothetical protein